MIGHPHARGSCVTGGSLPGQLSNRVTFAYNVFGRCRSMTAPVFGFFELNAQVAFFINVLYVKIISEFSFLL